MVGVIATGSPQTGVPQFPGVAALAEGSFGMAINAELAIPAPLLVAPVPQAFVSARLPSGALATGTPPAIPSATGVAGFTDGMPEQAAAAPEIATNFPITVQTALPQSNAEPASLRIALNAPIATLTTTQAAITGTEAPMRNSQTARVPMASGADLHVSERLRPQGTVITPAADLERSRPLDFKGSEPTAKPTAIIADGAAIGDLQTLATAITANEPLTAEILSPTEPTNFASGTTPPNAVSAALSDLPAAGSTVPPSQPVADAPPARTASATESTPRASSSQPTLRAGSRAGAAQRSSAGMPVSELPVTGTSAPTNQPTIEPQNARIASVPTSMPRVSSSPAALLVSDSSAPTNQPAIQAPRAGPALVAVPAAKAASSPVTLPVGNRSKTTQQPAVDVAAGDQVSVQSMILMHSNAKSVGVQTEQPAQSTTDPTTDLPSGSTGSKRTKVAIATLPQTIADPNTAAVGLPLQNIIQTPSAPASKLKDPSPAAGLLVSSIRAQHETVEPEQRLGPADALAAPTLGTTIEATASILPGLEHVGSPAVSTASDVSTGAIAPKANTRPSSIESLAGGAAGVADGSGIADGKRLSAVTPRQPEPGQPGGMPAGSFTIDTNGSITVPAPLPSTPLHTLPVRTAPSMGNEPQTLPAQSAIQPVVVAQPGRIGHDLGVAIAHRVQEGGDELIVRLSPAELGKVEVRMTFDERGGLRANIAADSPVALEMLRRDSADLSRSLSDAGVRSDGQSLRFDSGNSGGNNDSNQRSPWLDTAARSARDQPENRFGEEPEAPAYRHIRTSGRYDLLA